MTQHKITEDTARQMLTGTTQTPDHLPGWYIFKNDFFSKRQKQLQHEVSRLALDLDYILIRILDPAEKFEDFLEEVFTDKFKNKAADLMNNLFVGFDLIYHIENYSFRAKAQRNKVIQFISEAMKDNPKVKEELQGKWKSAFSAPPLSEVISLRERVTHNIHYSGSTKFDPWFMPSDQNWPKDNQELQRIWRERVEKSGLLIVESVKLFQSLNTEISEKIIESFSRAN
ncbi:MAG: hypothetical protein V1895_01445 [Parcubacteria group bacterium]